MSALLTADSPMGDGALLDHADASLLSASRVTMALRECWLLAFPKVLGLRTRDPRGTDVLAIENESGEV